MLAAAGGGAADAGDRRAALGVAGACVSWGFYALFKKTLPIGPAQGFFLEVLILCVPALAYIVWLQARGVGHFGGTGAADVWWLLGCGIVTAVPLILFANGAKLLQALDDRHHAVHRADDDLLRGDLHLQGAVHASTTRSPSR